MRPGIVALVATLLWQASTHVAPEPRYFRFQRSIHTSGLLSVAAGSRQCAELDGATYAHSAPDLADVRLFSNGAEVPYAFTVSDTATQADTSARVLNAGMRAGRLEFDLQMPPLNYSSVTLNLDGTDFVAEARVTGLGSTNATAGTALGTYNLYDLTGQHLGRSTALNLQESRFPLLHVSLAGRRASPFAVAGTASGGEVGGGIPSGTDATVFTPESIRGAEVPPSRAAQTIYTKLIETTDIRQVGNVTRAVLHVPAHVPVERVSFDLKPMTPNFSRDVSVSARLEGTENQAHGGESSGQDGGDVREDGVGGTITHVYLPVRFGASNGADPINQYQLSVPAVLGINSQRGMEVTVDVHNGDDRPVTLASVSLEMRQRDLCFDVQPGPITMFYGDPALVAPVYDYARTFNVGWQVAAATLEPEQLNPLFTPRPQPRVALTERHPGLLWAALLLVVGALGFVAFRSSRTVGTAPRA